ncbi:MAG: hypothetical protein HY594_01185 [Candidatus Omnitrophica bacterium]|nr:hypothetical protein [Candidatus Omnitrophota bacterium]
MKNWPADPMLRLLSILAVLCLCIGPLTAHADEIYLTSGERLKGLVVEEHLDRVVLSTVDGERTVLRSAIDEIFFDDPERNYVYLGNEALAEADINAAAALFRKALQLNPEFEEARDAIRRAEERRQKMNKGWSVINPETQLQKYGLQLESTGRFPVVASVRPEGVAFQAGLHAGDGIVAIWGESMAYQPASVAAERLLGLPETTVKVTIERKASLIAGKHAWPGFEMEMSPQGLSVSRVLEGGHPAGLQQGDIVHFLNGHPTRYLPLASARNTVMQSRSKDKGLVLTLRRHIFIQRPTEG